MTNLLERLLEIGALGNLKGLAREQIRVQVERNLLKLFHKHERKVAQKVRHAGDRSIREIILHLWGTILGGTIGDTIRDEQERKIFPICAPLIEEDTPEPLRIQIVTREVARLVAQQAADRFGKAVK